MAVLLLPRTVRMLGADDTSAPRVASVGAVIHGLDVLEPMPGATAKVECLAATVRAGGTAVEARPFAGIARIEVVEQPRHRHVERRHDHPPQADPRAVLGVNHQLKIRRDGS